MNRIQILKRLDERIWSCYMDLKLCRMRHNDKSTIECFRNRLDELLLFYSYVNEITFVKSCEYFGIKYEEVDSPKA